MDDGVRTWVRATHTEIWTEFLSSKLQPAISQPVSGIWEVKQQTADKEISPSDCVFVTLSDKNIEISEYEEVGWNKETGVMELFCALIV